MGSNARFAQGRASVLSRRSSLFDTLSGIGQSSQSDHAGAMSFDQLIEYGDGLTLPTVEQPFGGCDQI